MMVIAFITETYSAYTQATDPPKILLFEKDNE